MGDISNIKINDDDSVTTLPSAGICAGENLDAKKRCEIREALLKEAAIIDILNIEKAKGGAFAPRRMKRRALEYAKSAGIPEHVVEKIMMNRFPNDFANYSKTTSMIVWLWVIGIFICGAVILGIFAADEFSYFSNMKDDANRYELLRHAIESNDRESLLVICTRQTYWDGKDLSIDDIQNILDNTPTREEWIVHIKIHEKWYTEKSNNIFEDFIYYLLGVIACLGVAGVGVWQFAKTKRAIIESGAKSLVKSSQRFT